MKLKRTSLLFDKGIRDAIKKNPDMRYSDGMQKAIDFIADVMRSNFKHATWNESVPTFPGKLFSAGYSECDSLASAFEEASRISSVVDMFTGEALKVRMNFFCAGICVFILDATFLIETGECCSIGRGSKL